MKSKSKNWILYIAILGGLGFMPFIAEEPKENKFSTFSIFSMSIGFIWLMIWLFVWIRYTSYINYKNGNK